MTAFQYLYPYFFDLPTLNAELKPFHYLAHLSIDHDHNDNEHLVIQPRTNHSPSKPSSSLVVQHGERLMIHKNRLYIWSKYFEGIEIRQFDLDQPELSETMLTDFVNTHALPPGIHPHPTALDYNYFITFHHKDNLELKELWHEKYIIIILHHQQVAIIPFDSFNETGGDPLYVWPALASIEPATGKLHGIGMRMGSFTIALDKEFIPV